MPVLNNIERAALVGNRPTFVNVNIEHPTMVGSACWAWALRGQFWNVNAADGAVELYKNNNPLDEINGGNRTAMDTSAIPRTDPRVVRQLRALVDAWEEACIMADDNSFRDFMRKMMKVVARVSGLQPSAVATPYRLYMTTPKADWFNWQHWGIAVEHGGQWGFAQTEPGNDLTIGGPNLAEAHLPDFLTAYIHLVELHQTHVDVIRTALMKPPRGAAWKRDGARFTCRGCHRPFVGGHLNRKHHCHRCGDLFCRRCVQNDSRGILYRLMANGPAHDYQAAPMCNSCERLNRNRY